MSNFSGYEMFHHVRNPALRTYNRINTYLTIRDRHGKDVGKNYLRKFNPAAQGHIFSMMAKIHNVGYEQFRRDFVKGVING